MYDKVKAVLERCTHAIFEAAELVTDEETLNHETVIGSDVAEAAP